MKRGQFSLKEMIGQPGEAKREPEAPAKPPEAATATLEAVPSLEELSPLPLPSASYQAHARASNRPVATLHLLMADASTRGFSYANLDTLDLLPADKPGQGPMIVLRFHGIMPQEVTLTGRNLDTLYLYLGSHRLTWVRQRPPSRDFIAETETVVTGITISKLGDGMRY